jgi:5-formyltetrahydrofolate cyclo-ligase
MTKSQLRQLYLQKREALSEAEYLQLNRQLCDLFFVSVDLSFINTLHIFLPIRAKREPDTWLLIDRIRREFPHVRLSLPKVNEHGSLDNIYFEGLHQLVKNNWGIEEPRHGVPTPAEKIDLVLVPLLCVDANGNRVGYGKGFYDKFLASCRPDCKKIGLSFFQPVEVMEDVNEFDVAVNAILTPFGYLQLRA